MSKAFRFHRHGGPEVLVMEEVEVGTPGPGQVRMRNKAVAVNYRDILMRRGVHAVKSLPSGIGLESAGVIEAIGPRDQLAGFESQQAFLSAVQGRIDAFGLEYAWAPLDDITLEAFVGVPSFREGVPVRPTATP